MKSVTCAGLFAMVLASGSAQGGVTVSLVPSSPTISQGGSVNVQIFLQFTGLTPMPTDRFGAAATLLDVQFSSGTPAGVTLAPFLPLGGSGGSLNAAPPISVASGNVIDHNADNIINGFDLLAFGTDWNSGLSSADFNGDTNIDPDDLADYISALYIFRDAAGPAPLPGLLDIAIASSHLPPFSTGGMTSSNVVLIGSFTVQASTGVPVNSVFMLNVNPLTSGSISPIGLAGRPSDGELIGDSIELRVVVPSPSTGVIAGMLTLAALRRRRPV